MSEYILELWRLTVVAANKTLACLDVEFAGSVPCRGVLLGRLVAFSLYRVDVKQLRTFHVLYVVQHPYKFLYVVSVYRT